MAQLEKFKGKNIKFIRYYFVTISIIVTNERKKSSIARLDIVVVSVLANEKEYRDVKRKPFK